MSITNVQVDCGIWTGQFGCTPCINSGTLLYVARVGISRDVSDVA